jgi:K+:H+ antiporter
MDVWQLLLEIILLLGSAFVFGAVAQRLNQSAVIGYLLSGIIFGPLLFNRETVLNMAEIGVSLLLFSIGLEFSIKRFKSLGRFALMGGTVQVLGTVLLFTLSLSFFFGFIEALVCGTIVALSSTAVVLRVLVDRMEVDSIRGRNALGILLLQDMAVVPLVLMVTMLGQGGDAWHVVLQIAKTLASAGIIVAAFYLVFYHIVPKILLSKNLFKNRELVILLAIVAAMGSAWMAHAMGLSAALGAFLAGMILGESPFATQIRSDIASLRTLFVTLFFTSIGMVAEPKWFVAHWNWIFLTVGIVFIGKSMIVYIVSRLFRISRYHALATGFTLGQIGEFSFLLAGVASGLSLISRDMFSLVIAVTIMAMFLTPYMVGYAPSLARRLLGLFPSRFREMPVDAEKVQELSPCNVYIIGFGPAGQKVAEELSAYQLSSTLIELNPSTAKLAESRAIAVHLGDATRGEVISHAGVTNDSLVVITVPDPNTCREIIEKIRLASPQAVLFVRSRYHRSMEDLKRAGANIVVDEEDTVGRMLSKEIIHFLRDGNRLALSCALAGEDPKE